MKLNSLFTDHAVLQQGISIPVWGATLPNVHVTAEIAGKSSRTLSGPSGSFILRLPPLPAGGPHTLTVSADAPGETIRIEDVCIGEVWVCSGQSNMQFTVASGHPDPEPESIDAIRMITVPNHAEVGRQTDFEGNWKTATLENVELFSGVGYFFARRLHNKLNVPVGMIHTSWGGTRVEAWTSRESLVESPLTAHMVFEYEANLADKTYWEQAGMLNELPQDPGNIGEGKGWAQPDFDDNAWATATLPAAFSSFHTPATNGAFWFRKTVPLPDGWIGQPLTLRIGGADKHDITYFNGTCVGATGAGVDLQFWDIPREYPVPASENTTRTATIAVRVWSHVYGGGLIGPAQNMRLERADGAGEAIPLKGVWRLQIEHDIGLTPPPNIPYLPGNANAPYTLFNSMTHPLLPYAIRGAIWYQGESNTPAAKDYFVAHCNMIRDWRHAWGQGNFPFICVQLANFNAPVEYEATSTWAHIREAQLKTTRTLPNVGMASAIDIGEAADIHPRNKRDVGHRLAQWALAHTYHRPIVPNGPHYAGYTLEGDAIRIHFTEVGGGLVIAGPDKRIKTCWIAGSNRKFVPAQATIDGDTLLVHTAGIPAPKAVRYAWADNPDGCNLYNAEGFPASPFRTDTW